MTTAHMLTVVAAPPSSGKTAWLLARYRDVLGGGRPGAALWLAPTWRAAAEVRERLLEGLPGVFSPGVMTFEKFADAVLETSPLPVRPMTQLMKRQVIRHLIDVELGAGHLEHFGPIARTGGLVNLIGGFISELKRLEIWPEHFDEACRRRGASRKDVELLGIYDAYQQCLLERNLYDPEGRFWSARDWLQRCQTEEPGRGGHRPFPRLQLVVVDGFTDFTRTQHEILEVLAERVEAMFVSLPLEAKPRRADLFAKPEKTLAELRRRHKSFIVEELFRKAESGERKAEIGEGKAERGGGESVWPAMTHVERNVFGNPRNMQPAADTRGIEVLAAARQIGEIELIGRKIKRLLTVEGVAPGDVAVVFRSLGDVTALVDEVFGRLGIPFAIESGLPLQRSPALAALVRLLQTDLEDWPYRQLLAVLRSNYFRPHWPEWREGRAAVDAERSIRHLQIPRGRARLLEQLQAEQSDDSRNGEAGDGGDANGQSRSARVLALLARFAATLDALPQKASPAEWAVAWQRLAEETGLAAAIEEDVEDNTIGQTDRMAWLRLKKVLDDGSTLSRWLEQEPPQWNRREALAALVDILASESLGSAGDESGRVRVLSATSVRALKIPYLFVAGLSEKAFPPPDREDRLYSEAESQQLIDAGLPLVARAERNREEMLLFYEVITRATCRLYLSYPCLDESAQPLSPSPYLTEVEQACGAGRITRTEQADLSPIPLDDDPLSSAELRVKATATALAGNVALLAGLSHHNATTAQPLLAALSLCDERQRRDGFGPAEGILSAPAVVEQLQQRFDPAGTFRATSLERYASCPFRFFSEEVLRLRPVEDIELAVDRAERGRLAHDVLATFHRRLNDDHGGPTSPASIDQEEFERRMAEAFRQHFEPVPANPVAAALREIDRRVLTAWLNDYRRQHADYDKLSAGYDRRLCPARFEESFGHTPKVEGESSLFTLSDGEVPPLELEAGQTTIRISGRIDRIDTGEVDGTPVANVIDYKTGSSTRFSLESVLSGVTLQLPLYAMATAELILDDLNPVPWQAGYWYLREKGFPAKKSLVMYEPSETGVQPTEDWETIRMVLPEVLAALVTGMRTGQFPVYNVDEHCTRNCPLKTVCRIQQIRWLEKTWSAMPEDEPE